MNSLRDRAVVLRAYRSGESDRVVVLWSEQHGKVRAIARGVRKTTSKLGSGIEPLAFIDVLLGHGRGELMQIRQATHVERFTQLRDDFDRLNAGLALAEAIDAVPLDGVPDGDIFDMLVRALASLDNPAFHPYLVPAAFYFKLLALDGSAPQLDECVNCGDVEGLVAFDAEVGGVLCGRCRSGRVLSPPALEILRRLLGGGLGTILAAPAPAGSAEVHHLAIESLERHFGRRLKVPRTMEPPPGA